MEVRYFSKKLSKGIISIIYKILEVFYFTLLFVQSLFLITKINIKKSKIFIHNLL